MFSEFVNRKSEINNLVMGDEVLLPLSYKCSDVALTGVAVFPWCRRISHYRNVQNENKNTANETA